MKTRIVLTGQLFLIGFLLSAQIEKGVYQTTLLEKGNPNTHQIKVQHDYFIYTIYSSNPAKFIKTIGGFYKIDDDVLRANLEFNSNFKTDGINTVQWPISQKPNALICTIDGNTFEFTKQAPLEQDLDGMWMFGTRGPDTGQERRGDCCPRKTLKFLVDGQFQWIAYNTEDMRFSGSGGGSYVAKNNKYTENIQYFSRDNSRVGASLVFNYTLKGKDWHHTGKNSKGEPMYEIWMRRE